MCLLMLARVPNGRNSFKKASVSRNVLIRGGFVDFTSLSSVNRLTVTRYWPDRLLLVVMKASNGDNRSETM